MMVRTRVINAITTAFTLAIFALVLVLGITTNSIREHVLDDRVRDAKQHIHIAMTILDTHHKQYTDGEMSLEKAQQSALNHLGRIRFSHNEYFWVNTTTGFMLLHPDQTLHNSDGWHIKDGSGRELMKEFVELTKTGDGAYVTYQWIEPGDNEYTQKVSYVQPYTKWGWVVGTGIHTKDINNLFVKLFILNFIVAFIAVAIMFALIKFTTSCLRNTVHFDKV